MNNKTYHLAVYDKEHKNIFEGIYFSFQSCVYKYEYVLNVFCGVPIHIVIIMFDNENCDANIITSEVHYNEEGE